MTLPDAPDGDGVLLGVEVPANVAEVLLELLSRQDVVPLFAGDFMIGYVGPMAPEDPEKIFENFDPEG